MAEFSFQNDVAPYASRFFSEVEADPYLSRNDKAQLQGSLLGGVQDIETQRLQLAEEKERGKLRSLQYNEGVLAFDEAKARRARIEQAAGKRTALKQEAQGIVAGADTPEEKQRKLAALRLANSDTEDPDVRSVFDAAQDALPAARKANFSPEQLARFAAEDVPANVLASGDPYAIGQAISEAARRKETLEARKKEAETNSAARQKLLESELKFAKGEDDIESDWLEPESTIDAELIVNAFGTPEEKQKFADLKNAESDTKRALLVRGVQLRERTKGLAGDKKLKASSITGL